MLASSTCTITKTKVTPKGYKIESKVNQVMLILGDRDQAFKLSFYPNNGIGLMRLEFIINNAIQIHPMALVQFDKVIDPTVKEQIEKLTHHY